MNTISFQNQAPTPSKIICVGRNYANHAKELNNDIPSEPVIFLKPNSAISQELHTQPNEEIHFETEIALLIRQGHVVGAGIGMDLTKRTIQTQLKAKGLPWEKSKAFDGSAVFTPFVPIQSIDNLALSLHINNELRQQGHVNEMLFSPSAIIQDIQKFMSLNDNDIIMTGTPAGVGKVIQGDVFEVALYLSQDGENTALISHQWIAQ